MSNTSKEAFIPFSLPKTSSEELLKLSVEHYKTLDKRRSCRYFSEKKVPKKVIENLIKTASSAPSGAHKQPWTFVAISNTELKKKIRTAAEKEEREFYESRAPQEWLDDLAPLGTDWEKPFLEIAPWIVVLFKKSYDDEPSGRQKNYYVNESVGIAAGFFINAVHGCNLATLTHTPSPMNFLSEILNRPKNEKPYLLLPVGYPAKDAEVPNLQRKSLKDIAVFVE